ncbi:MAG: hypothetical protein SPL80_01850 [Bacilli bacterium]|nr:hypothetical protein [Bacilli bacterium]
MKKSILLGLGACALALGGVAALVGQKGAAATEAAGLTETTTYKIDISSFAGWAGEKEGFNLYAFTEAKTATTPAWPGNAIASSNIVDNVITVSVPANSLWFIINGQGKQTIDIRVSDISNYTFECASALTDGGLVTGSWTNDGWYFLSAANGWGYNATVADKTLTPDAGQKGKWSNISLSADDEFKLVYYNTDGSLDWGQSKGHMVLNENYYFGVGENDNVKALYDGTYNFVLTNDYSITISPADDETAVNNFVAKYITAQAAEAYGEKDADTRAADCATKYGAASAAYSALTQDQKDLFNSDASYAAARLAYNTWAAAVPSGTIRFVASQSVEDNSATGLVITLIASALAATMLAGIVIIRKRRADRD